MSQSEAESVPPPTETPAPDVAPPPSSVGRTLRAGAVGAGLAVLALAGAGAASWVKVRPYVTGPSNTELQSEIADLRSQLAQLQSAAGQSVAGQPDDAGSLAGRVDALEAAMRSAAPASAPRLAEEVSALAERVDRLGKSGVDASALLGLTQRLDKLEAGLREIQADRSTAGGMLLALGQLRDAVDRAAPFSGELQIVGSLLPKGAEVDAALDVLKERSATGIPTGPTLAQRFDALEPAVIRAEVLPPGNGWWRQTLERLMVLVSVRRETDIGGEPSAATRAARVRQRLASGELGAAAAEAEGFTGGPAQVVAPWLRDVKARVAADQALSALTARTAAAAGPRH